MVGWLDTSARQGVRSTLEGGGFAQQAAGALHGLRRRCMRAPRLPWPLQAGLLCVACRAVPLCCAGPLCCPAVLARMSTSRLTNSEGIGQASLATGAPHVGGGNLQAVGASGQRQLLGEAGGAGSLERQGEVRGAGVGGAVQHRGVPAGQAGGGGGCGWGSREAAGVWCRGAVALRVDGCLATQAVVALTGSPNWQCCVPALPLPRLTWCQFARWLRLRPT